MGGDHDRFQGDGDHLGAVVDQPRDPQQQLLQRGGVHGRRAAPAEEDRGRPDGPDQLGGVAVGGGYQAVRGVAEEFGGCARQAEGEDGAGRRVDGCPHDGVDTAGGHRLHDGPELGGLAEQVGEFAVGAAQRGFAVEVQADSAEVGPVAQMGRGGLQRHGVAESGGAATASSGPGAGRVGRTVMP